MNEKALANAHASMREIIMEIKITSALTFQNNFTQIIIGYIFIK